MNVVLPLFLFAGCWADESPPPEPTEGPVDIILVSMDTLRADHVGVYGAERDTTPFMDGLATRGVRFAHARSPSPWTLPTHTTLLTGQHTRTHRVVDDDVQVDLSVPVLSEIMKSAGYATAGFVSTLYVSRRFGFERGFDHFEDFDITTERKNLAGEVDAEDVVDAVLGVLGERTDDTPMFLFLHFYDAHYPYEAPSPHDEVFDRPGRADDVRYRNYFHFKQNPLEADQLEHQIAQYDEEIRYLDGQLSRLRDAHAASGRRAIWVLTSDHGEEFFERGSWGHAHTLYPEQLDVPLIVSGPGIPEGVVVGGTVSLEDVAPTLAELAGTEMPTADGIRLTPYLDGLTEPPERAFLSGTSRFKTNRVGLLEEGLRLDWNLKTRRAALYADSKEAEDVSRSRRSEVVRMKKRVTEILGAPWEASSGVVQSEGTLLADGKIRKGPLIVNEARSFVVVPVDAGVSLDGDGPYRSAGGPWPEPGADLSFSGGTSGRSTELSSEDRARLEALGYVQDEE